MAHEQKHDTQAQFDGEVDNHRHLFGKSFNKKSYSTVPYYPRMVLIQKLLYNGTRFSRWRKVFDAVDEANVKGRVKLANILFSLLIFRMQR